MDHNPGEIARRRKGAADYAWRLYRSRVAELFPGIAAGNGSMWRRRGHSLEAGEDRFCPIRASLMEEKSLREIIANYPQSKQA